MECAQTRTATLLKLYVKTQGIQVSQSTFPPDFREWPEGKLFLETSLLSCLQTREAALQLSGHFPPFLLPEVLSRLPQRSLIHAWLGTSVRLHTLLLGEP